MGNITIIASGAKQSGKSTTAFNLALCYASIAEQAILIDLQEDSWVGKICNPKGSEEAINVSPFLTYLQCKEIDQEDIKDFKQVLINCPIHKNMMVFNAINSGAMRVLIPVEMEFYGLNELSAVLGQIKNAKIEAVDLIPVMLRKGVEASEGILAKLQEQFGDMVIKPAIQRNYYLAKQKDFRRFELSRLTEKAAFAYLECAKFLMKEL